MEPYFGAHSHPAFEHDVDVPLDDFDKGILAEIPEENRHHPASGRARLTLPPCYHGQGSRLHQHRALLNNLYEGPFMGSSSPTYAPVSSPTVSALQNRRVTCAKALPQHTRPQIHPPRAKSGDRQLAHKVPPESSNIHGPPVIQGIPLVCTDELPDKIRSIFPYELLNAIQSKCFSTAFQTDDNLVLTAPTGSGKTLVMEMAIARLMVTAKNSDFKVVYMAPIKALCAERQQDWHKKFGVHGLMCAELTGDIDYNQLRKVQQADIIITTPEKWDSVTRKWRDNSRLVQLIKLFLVDEAHILKDSRGATLEAVVSRMKSMGTSIRFIALSATVPNSEDIATWLGKDSTAPQLPAQREVFDESFRPVKLEKHVYGFQGGSNDFQFDVKLRNQVPDTVLRHSKGKPTMIFCMTRKSSVQTAHALASMWGQSPNYQKPWKASTQPAAVKDKDLRKLIAAGVAFHHAGINSEDRRAIEQGFCSGTISVICSTSTLAMGVNLPCYMVVLQGTMSYGDTGPQEYSDLEVMQMLGRAGRLPFETSACAAILTREEKVERYRKIVSGQDVLESTLHRNLIEHLNAEIGLGTIFDLQSAKHWLASTFLRVRLGKNPGHYQLKEGEMPRAESEMLQQICEKDISLLRDADLVNDDIHLTCTELGNAMARYYVKFETMKTLAAIPPKAKISEILSVLAQASEFLEIRMRGGEKSFYKELNKANEIRYPINVDIALSSHKVSLILQAQLGSVQEPSGPNYDKHHAQYHTDAFAVFSHANRLIRCIIDHQLFLKDATSARNALELARSLSAKAWDNTPNILKQVPGIGDVYMRKLASKGVSSIDSLLASDPHRIELILGKSPPFGHEALRKLSNFPNLMVSIKEIERKVRAGESVTLKLKCEVGFLNEIVPLKFGRAQVHVCFLLEDSNGMILDFRRFGARKLENGEEVFLTVVLTKPTYCLRSYVMCDELAGTTRYAELHLRDIPSSVYPKPTNAPQAGLMENSQGMSDPKPNAPDMGSFDDDSVGDDELLAAGTRSETVEVVKDIDELMLEMERNSQEKRQSKTANQHSSKSPLDDGEDMDENEFKEPVQLENGRWSCQHLCKDKGIECKHKCCRSGVAKPRRRPRKTVKPPGHDGKQQKLTSLGAVTKQSSSSAKTSARSLDKLHNVVTASATSWVGSEAEAFSGPRASKKRKVSPANDGEDESSRSNARYNGTKRGLTSAEAHVRNEDEHDASAVYENPLDEILGSDDLWDPEDCDWNLPLPFQESDISTEHGCVGMGTGTDQGYLYPDSIDEPGQASSGIDQAPIKRVVMSHVQLKPGNKLFIEGEISSPVKPDQRTASDYKQPSSDSFFGTPINVEDFLNEASNQQKPDLNRASPIMGGSRDSLASGPVVQTSDVTVGKGKWNGKLETEEDRKKDHWEEDQKRRWDQLEPWMYEQFHAFVELV